MKELIDDLLEGSDVSSLRIAIITGKILNGPELHGELMAEVVDVYTEGVRAAERERLLAGGTVPEEMLDEITAVLHELRSPGSSVQNYKKTMLCLVERAAALAEKRALMGMAEKWFDAYQAACAISVGGADFRWAEGRVPAAHWVELLDMLSGQGDECERRAEGEDAGIGITGLMLNVTPEGLCTVSVERAGKWIEVWRGR